MDALPSAFGDLLRTLRKRRKFTQQNLGDLIGVHRNTISFWERGDFLPESKGLVLEMARTLHLEELETCQLLEASFTTVAPRWAIPVPRNAYFIGREKLLEAIHHLLTDRSSAQTRAIACTGLAGIGKTQLAIEYAYRHRFEYCTVLWLAAETSESLLSSLYQMADFLQLTIGRTLAPKELFASVQRWLQTHQDWLLIADDVGELTILQAILPPTRQGAFLLTTRRQALGALVESLEVPPLSCEEGAMLLLHRARRLNGSTRCLSSRESSAAAEIAQLLGGLPLALDQAGAYIEETGCQIAEYGRRYVSQRKQILARRGNHGGAHPASVTTTLLLAIEQVERVHPAATDLLRACAFLDPRAIPEALLIAGAAQLGPELRPIVADEYQFDLILAILRSTSLLARHPETRTLSIHPLVQAVLQDQFRAEEARLWAERTLLMLYASFSGGGLEIWRRWEQLMPHLEAWSAALSDLPQTPELVELLERVAGYLSEHASTVGGA